MPVEDERGAVREGPDAARRFESVLGRVLTVSKDELTKRETAWKRARKTKKARSKKPHA
jgi:hypothetical protein